MTCIVGALDGTSVMLGADSAGVSGFDLQIRADLKVFRSGPFVMGFTTSFRMGQLLAYSLKPPSPTGALMEFMAVEFVNAVRACLKDGGFAQRQNESESGGQFLVGVSGRLFIIENDYQVAEMETEFAAIGLGAGYALGALAVTGAMRTDRRLRRALGVAERFCTGVRGPFHLISTGDSAKAPGVCK